MMTVQSTAVAQTSKNTQIKWTKCTSDQEWNTERTIIYKQKSHCVGPKKEQGFLIFMHKNQLPPQVILKSPLINLKRHLLYFDLSFTVISQLNPGEGEGSFFYFMTHQRFDFYFSSAHGVTKQG